MKIRIYNNWGRKSKQYGCIRFLRVYWQFDTYAKSIEIEILNFIISIDMDIK